MLVYLLLLFSSSRVSSFHFTLSLTEGCSCAADVMTGLRNVLVKSVRIGDTRDNLALGLYIQGTSLSWPKMQSNPGALNRKSAQLCQEG